MADHRVLSNLDLVSPYELGKTVIKYNVVVRYLGKSEQTEYVYPYFTQA